MHALLLVAERRVAAGTVQRGHHGHSPLRILILFFKPLKRLLIIALSFIDSADTLIGKGPQIGIYFSRLFQKVLIAGERIVIFSQAVTACPGIQERRVSGPGIRVLLRYLFKLLERLAVSVFRYRRGLTLFRLAVRAVVAVQGGEKQCLCLLLSAGLAVLPQADSLRR